MEKPRVMGYDCFTGKTIDREMTDEEYAEFLARQTEPVDE